jgi:hypothetical protein
MFRCNHHHQGAHHLSLLKLQLLKQSIKIHRCGLIQVPNSVADIHQQGPDKHMKPHHEINQTDVF